MERTRPNIVLIMADDLGFSDLGCYGGEIHTPNLDRLAAGGLRFSHFYNNGVCVATRAGLLTGLYPQQLHDSLGHDLQRAKGNVTLAEILKKAGYRTLMSGKWHSGSKPGSLPVDRGFDRYWGLLSGGSNYFNPGEKRSGEVDPVHKKPGDHRPWGDDGNIMFPYTPEDRDFYATDAFTDRAVGFLDRYGRNPEPFFLYLAYTAPHFPMQAREEDVARYQGTYRVGWDELRHRRFRRQVEMGLVDERWRLSDREAYCPSWDEAEDKDRWDRKMAVYAAMVERMDRGIGRVVDRIRALGKDEDTLILFLSDNGGCGEPIDNTPGRQPGTVDTYTTVDAPWANASNTPFRKFKIYDHEGGISTPLIANWPRAIKSGQITHQVGHIMDFLPTLAELAGAEYPGTFNGVPVIPGAGESLLPIFKNQLRTDDRPLFWELWNCRAVRKGRWKLVTMGPARPGKLWRQIEPGHEGWELYDIEADRCEGNDLSRQHPEVVRELDGLWKEWYERCRRDREGMSVDRSDDLP